jgi:hypothetical protein
MSRDIPLNRLVTNGGEKCGLATGTPGSGFKYRPLADPCKLRVNPLNAAPLFPTKVDPQSLRWGMGRKPVNQV